MACGWRGAVHGHASQSECSRNPSGAISQSRFPAEELEVAVEGPEDNLLRPSTLITVAVQGAEDEAELLDVRMVEMEMAVRSQLERKGSRTRRPFTAFGVTASVLPSIRDLKDAVESWVESAEGRLEDYYTAQEDTAVPAQVEQDMSAAILVQLQELTIFRASRDRMEDLLDEVRGQVSPTPLRTGDEPRETGIFHAALFYC